MGFTCNINDDSDDVDDNTNNNDTDNNCTSGLRHACLDL